MTTMDGVQTPCHANLGPISPEGEAWRKRSVKLVEYVADHLVNRIDIHGQYMDDGTQFTCKKELTPAKFKFRTFDRG